MNYYKCGKCGLISVAPYDNINLAGSECHHCGGRLHPTKRPDPDFDPVIIGARYIAGLATALVVIVLLGVWAAFGCPLPSLPQAAPSAQSSDQPQD